MITLSKGKNELSSENLVQVNLPLTSAEIEKIKSGKYKTFYINKKLIFDDTENVKMQKERTENLSIVEKIKSGAFQNKDLANLLQKLIT